MHSSHEAMLTYGGHLAVLRKMVVRIILVTTILSGVIFAFKDFTFKIILAPSESGFVTYRLIERFMSMFDPTFRFEDFNLDLIATDLSSQFMAHILTSIYLGLVCASPYIVYQLFKFVSPALLEHERKYSVQVVTIVYVLFVAGVLMSYFVLFPISFRFLGTYSVAEKVHSSITIDSYISTFTTLTLIMGVIFQLPVVAFALAKMRLVASHVLVEYRRWAFLIICVVAAIITPPDVMTLILVAVPLYALYEVSIRVIKAVERRREIND